MGGESCDNNKTNVLNFYSLQDIFFLVVTAYVNLKAMLLAIRLLILFVCLGRLQSYIIDYSFGVERRFDGIGGLSGGGVCFCIAFNVK